MELLITSTEFATYRNINKKVDADKVNEAILYAQQSDLNNVLGDFFFDVLANKDETAWQPLLDGGSFDYNGETFIHEGIKKMLADYTYARYMYMINVNLTSFGATVKKSENSEPIDRNLIRDLTKQAQIDAGNKFRYIEKYILSNPGGIFDRYCKTKTGKTGFNSVKIFKI